MALQRTTAVWWTQHEVYRERWRYFTKAKTGTHFDKCCDWWPLTEKCVYHLQAQRFQNLFYLHLFTELFHENLSSTARWNTDFVHKALHWALYHVWFQNIFELCNLRGAAYAQDIWDHIIMFYVRTRNTWRVQTSAKAIGSLTLCSILFLQSVNLYSKNIVSVFIQMMLLLHQISTDNHHIPSTQQA